MFKRFEKLVLTDDVYNRKKGTICLYGESTYESGYLMHKIIIIDKDYYSFLKENNFRSFEDYIQYQNDYNIFGDQYWMNPFNSLTLYDQDFKSLSDIQNTLKKIEKKRILLEKEESFLKKLLEEATS